MSEAPFAICQCCQGPIWAGGMAFAYEGAGGGWLYVHRFLSTCDQVRDDRDAKVLDFRPV